MIYEQRIQDLSISKKTKIIDALKLMDKASVKLLIVSENNKLISLLSIGDIQRAIINNTSLDSTVEFILRKNINIATEFESIDEIKNRMLELRAECMPVVDQNGFLTNIYFWNDFFGTENEIDNSKIDIPVVIMAGGKGTRLKPLTNVLPKPLIPVGDMPIMETIIESFSKIGCKRFYSTVNYKADMIEYYFKNKKKDYDLEFIREKDFLGTAGSIRLLKNELNETFFISNCDILINEDYRKVLEFHKHKDYDITIIVSMKNYFIPYGTIEMDTDGMYKSLKEKPELNFMINTGMYILEPKVIEEIKDDEFIHITTLIDNCSKKGMKIGIFPISEASWSDMGQWDEYLNMINIHN